MKFQKQFLFAFALLIGFYFPGCNQDHSDHSDHSGHSGHSGHEVESNDHDEHGADVVQLSDDQLMSSGVVIAPLAGGEIATRVSLPAEIGLNKDALLHVTPRVSGIVSQVNGLLGHQVEVGELLAIIQSPELGEAKIAYLQEIQDLSIADAQLARQEIVSQNTAKLLDILRDEPSPDDLRKRTTGLRIGMDKGRLLSAYVQVKSGAAKFELEKELDAKGLTTQADLLEAQEVFYSSQAQYMAAFEDVDFTFRLKREEALQRVTVLKSKVENARRRLYLHGLTQEQITLVENEPGINMGVCQLTSPMAGRVVWKHITPGEVVDSQASVYTIADLSTVWLNISVYAQYSSMIKEGQLVTVNVDGRSASGVVEYISAIVSESTRTAAARVALDNSDGLWKPGVFVTVQVEINKLFSDRVVPLGAIQSFEGNTVVFIQDEDGIEPVAVTVGQRNDTHVELLGTDIPIGTPVVIANSFLIKAELGKGSAGHQH